MYKKFTYETMGNQKLFGGIIIANSWAAADFLINVFYPNSKLTGELITIINF